MEDYIKPTLGVSPKELADRQLTIANEGAFDENDPRSLINILPEHLKESLLKAKNFYLQDLSSESIRKNIAHTNEYKTVRALRQSFWKEYSFAQDSHRKMQATRIWQGVCTTWAEYNAIIGKEHFCAFIFDRPIKQEMAEKELLEVATENMFKILSSSPVNQDGTLNPFIAKVQIDLFKHLDERVQGGIIKQVSQKTENRTTNVNVNATAEQAIKMDQLQKVEDLGSRLAELREKTKDIEAMAHIVEEDDESTDN